MYRETETQKTLNRYTAILVAFVSCINLLAVAGWLLNKPILASIRPEYIPMAPGTALIFLGFCSVWLIQKRFNDRPGVRILVQWILVGMLTLVLILAVRYFTGFGPDLEKLLSPNPPMFGKILSARMSPLTALDFLLSIPALLLLTGRKPGNRIKTVSAILSFIVFILSGVYYLGYLFRAPLFYGGTFTPIALTTTLSFLFLSLGLMLTAGPTIWPLNTFVGNSIKARLMRVFLPVSFLIVLMQGLLSEAFNPWNINPAYRVAIAALLACIISIFIISFMAHNLGTEIERGDQARLLAEMTLAQSEARFRTLVETANDAIINIDQKGHIVFWNRAAELIFGYSVGEMIGKSLDVVMPGGFYTAGKQALERVELTGESQLAGTTFEVDGVRKNGQEFPLTLSLASWQVDGEVFFTGIARDITQRKRFELVQNASFRITQAAMTSDGIDALYESIHSILRELISAENFYIALYDSINGMISFPYYIDQYDQKPPAPTQTQGLTGFVIRSGQSLLATPEVYDRLIQQGEVEAIGTKGVDWLGVPLKSDGRIIGIIALQSYTQETHYNQEDVDLLEFVSSQVAQAIERKRLEEEIRSLSLTDELTGLNNRRGFTHLAEQELKLAHRKKRPMLLFFGDVDHLKLINDTLGHAQGDVALREITAILKDSFREADIMARIGGDEFVVLALDASRESAEFMTHRIEAALDEHNQQNGRSYHLTLSVGVARYDPASPSTVSELLARADSLMYLQKQARKENIRS